ncbi:hypothetical protein [Campylobacter rectus]|uniref:hypothetical protein n=1 Tax=Campylobacter rectus TaxID=203 RepID=UPI000F5F0695|nr:hypothetical protein [Campylobacter rectus]RRD54623.1 hypothetical protein EII16_04760 [Campylobacter rectus]
MKTLAQILFLLALAAMLGGCVFLNDRGVTTKYYNECKEYYDATGTYRKECPKNIIDWTE